jgi:hypothetical protein
LDFGLNCPTAVHWMVEAQVWHRDRDQAQESVAFVNFVKCGKRNPEIFGGSFETLGRLPDLSADCSSIH